MNTKNPSGSLLTCIWMLVLSVMIVTMITFPSCGRNKTGEANLGNIAPPELLPPPPSMEGSDTTWEAVDEIPLFPGGEELLVKYIGLNTKYPEAAKTKGIQGKVVVKFRISSKGNVGDYEITKSVSPELDAEALRVVKTITKFEPGRVDGTPVSSWYYLPISFTLK
jgi:periplasmic protein TonB